MNLKQIKTIPYKEKKLLVAEACLMYNKLKNIQSDISKTKKLADSLREGIMVNAKSFSVMDSVISLLSGEHEMIIRADFLEEQESKFWFLNYWSKSTYYRLKHEAVDQFLFLLYV